MSSDLAVSTPTPSTEEVATPAPPTPTLMYKKKDYYPYCLKEWKHMENLPDLVKQIQAVLEDKKFISNPKSYLRKMAKAREETEELMDEDVVYDVLSHMVSH